MKKKTMKEDEQISTGDAANLIYDLAPALTDCNKFLDKLLKIVHSNRNAQSKIQEFQGKMDEVMRIKNHLLIFALENQSEIV